MHNFYVFMYQLKSTIRSPPSKNIGTNLADRGKTRAMSHPVLGGTQDEAGFSCGMWHGHTREDVGLVSDNNGGG